MPILELSGKTISLIKSSQVITSLTSVLKELIENALDAGANVISVKLENYGFHKIEVKDNGSGIKEEDIPFIAQPHYTSKIRSFKDLECLSSYGFRGEALSSLCVVSDIVIISKTKDDSFGYSYSLNNKGNIKDKKPAAITVGTTVSVQNLFKNIPVRRQYYLNSKKYKDELKKAETLIQAFAIVNSSLHISLIHDRNIIFQKAATSDIKIAIHSVFHDLTKKLVYREAKLENLVLRLWLPQLQATCCCSSSEKLFLNINGRPVFHKPIEKLIKLYFSYKIEGPHGRYPIGVISITVPLNLIDVNLEPNKSRVFLHQEEMILENLEKLLVDIYGEITSGTSTKKSKGLPESIPCTLPLNAISQDESELTSHALNGKHHSVENSTVNDKRRFEYFSGNEEKLVNFTMNEEKRLENVTVNEEKRLENCTVNEEKRLNNISVNEKKLENITVNEKKLENVTAKERQFENSVNEENKPDDVTVIEEKLLGNSFKEGKLNLDTDHALSFEQSVLLDTKFIPISMSSDTKIFNKPEIVQRYNELSNINSIHTPKDDENQLLLINLPKGRDLQSIPPDIVPKNIPVISTSSAHIAKKNAENCISRSKDKDEEEFHDKWSRGQIFNKDGVNIQTVQILNPLPAPKAEMSPLEMNVKRKLSSVSSLYEKHSESPAKRLKLNPPNSSPMTSPIQKTETPFSLFAKSMRRQVIEENPGVDFTVIAQELALRWKNADAATKQFFEEKANESKGLKFKKLSLKTLPPNTPLNESKGQLHSYPAPLKHCQKRCLCIEVDLERIKRDLRGKRFQPQSNAIIGNLKGVNGWIYRLGNSLCTINIAGVNEIIVFKSLAESFIVPSIHLEEKIPINVGNFGEQDWQTLMNLHFKPSEQSGLLITDSRITSNGFKILLEDTRNAEVQSAVITHIPESPPNIGIGELKEILAQIRLDPNSLLEEARPLSLRKWFLDQTSRMIRGYPHVRDISVLIEKLNLWSKAKGKEIDLSAVCLHGKNIFTKLVSLTDL